MWPPGYLHRLSPETLLKQKVPQGSAQVWAFLGTAKSGHLLIQWHPEPPTMIAQTPSPLGRGNMQNSLRTAYSPPKLSSPSRGR